MSTHHRLLRTASTLFIGFIVCSGLTFPMSAAAASTRASIKMTAPSAKGSFAKEGSGVIPMAWQATNVPEDTLVILELVARKLAKGSTLGGGTWQQEIAAGNSTGSYSWDIENPGLADPGTYKVRALLQQCVSGDCTKNPFFPGMKKTKTYAKSKWTNITITKSARNESNEAASTIGTRPNGNVSVSLVMEGGSGDPITLAATDEPTFLYYPAGDVESCTVTAYYQGGKQTVTHGWKNGVGAGQYGRATFSAVDVYPRKSLQSVEVVCGNATYRASDTIRFVINASSAEADFKILIGKNGKSTYKKGEGTKEDAEAYCRQAYNDPEIHKFTRVQCYWDGVRFEDVSSFKG